MKIVALFVMLICVTIGVSATTVPNTTANPTPTIVPETTTAASTPTTPAATTASYDIDELNTYKYVENKKICLLVQFKGHFWKNKDVWHISSDAVINNKSSSCGKLAVKFHSGQFTIGFKQVGKSFQIDMVTAKLNKDVTAEAHNLTLAKASNGSSYLCSSGITVPLSSNVTFEMVDVQLQPFYVKDGQFGAAVECTGDLADNLLVPIIVGCVLGGLIVLVLLVYCIAQARMNRRYDPVGTF